MKLSPDDLILNGKYRVERLLGEGAFARVYLVRHLELDVGRAVKVLTRDTPGVGSTLFDDYQARFRLEAQLGARLDHHHVIKVYDFEVEEDALYLVMEYAGGGSLADLLKREGPLPIDDFVRIALDAASGLGAIHEQLEIVHRDAKPSNILLTQEGRAKIADLGLAQVEGGLSRRSVLGSEAAPHPGTPLYMSPEQEQESGYLQYPSDVYSLGCVMFEMLTGKPYKTQRPGTRVRDLRANVPERVDDLVSSSTAKDRDERPWDGREVADYLQEQATSWGGKSEQCIPSLLGPKHVAETASATGGDRPEALERHTRQTWESAVSLQPLEPEGLIVKVDRDLCIGSAMCVAAAPDVFGLDQNGLSYLIDPNAGDEHLLREAAESCPVQAITLEKGKGNQIYPLKTEELIVRVDRDLCIGSAMCVATAPNVFGLDQNGLSYLIDPNAGDEHLLREAAESCPVQAITLEKGKGNQIYP